MKRARSALALFALAALFLGACNRNVGSREATKATTPAKAFPDASLTIYPPTVFFVGLKEVDDEGALAWATAYQSGFRENARSFAVTLGLLLEESGYDHYEIADKDFKLPEGSPTRQERTAAFAKFVGEQDMKTDYALGTEFTIFAVPRKSGLYVYPVIVDANGNLTWADDRERHGKMEFDCLEVARERLRPVMALDTLPEKELAPDKKRILQEARAKQPPSGSERQAMKEQQEALKKAGASARVLVFPARVGGDRTEPNCATHLSSLLNDAGFCQASVAKTGPVMEGSGWPNEMHLLWLFARNVREYVRQHPADSNYVLFPDYWVNPRGQVWAVHFVICDRTGEWAIVDLQNSHQKAFQSISPKNLEDCDRLVLKRLKTELN